MPFNGSGGFVPLASPQFPAVANTTIISAYYNNVMNDVFAGLGACVTRDGQSPATANLPMGGFKHTGAAGAAGGGQYIVWGQTEAVSLGGALTVAGAVTLNGGLTLNSALSLTNGLLVTNATAPQIGLRSGAAGSMAYYDFGRTARDGSLGVSGGVSQMTTGDVAGDTTLRGEQRLWLGIAGTGHIRMDSTGILSQQAHSFTGDLGAGTLTTKVSLGTSSGFPFQRFTVGAANVDNKHWDWYANGDSMVFRSINDAYNAAHIWLQVKRSGAPIDYVQINGRVGFNRVPDVQPYEFGISPPSGGTGGLRVIASPTLGTQLLITGSAYNYAGVGGNQAWLYAQGTMDVNVGPDGAGTVALLSAGARRFTVSNSITTSFQTIWALADNGFRFTNAGNTIGGYLQAIPGIGTRLTSDTSNIVLHVSGADRFAVDTAGRISAASIHNNAAGLSGLTPYIGSGTYVPTFSSVSGVTGLTVTGAWNYMRVGNVVSVTGRLSGNTTAGVGPNFLVAIPISSAGMASGDLSGVGFLGGTSNANCLRISENAGAAQVSGAVAGTTGAVVFEIAFQYVVK